MKPETRVVRRPVREGRKVIAARSKERKALETRLAQNVQPKGLNPIQFAKGARRLIAEHGYTQESLARRLGRDRSTIANALRLLRLPDRVRAAVAKGELSEGHARALLGAPDEGSMIALADKVIRGRLTVRQAEALVRTAKGRARTRRASHEDRHPRRRR